MNKAVQLESDISVWEETWNDTSPEAPSKETGGQREQQVGGSLI